MGVVAVSVSYSTWAVLMVMPRAFSSGACVNLVVGLASPPNFVDSTVVIAAVRGGLAVVHVTNRSNVHVRFRPLKFGFAMIVRFNSNTKIPPWPSRKFVVPLTWIEHVASPLPRECSTTELHGHENQNQQQLERVKRIEPSS